jgi:hypothetical protein
MRYTVWPAFFVFSLLSSNVSYGFGCVSGAALGGVAGHMAHHTFLGMFGGCAGGMVVHHMYAAWKRKHPDGTMSEFVADNKDHLPAGWADKLGNLGDSTVPAGAH